MSTSPALRCPAWARPLLALAPLGDRRPEVTSDLEELFFDRRARYGAFHAHGRLLLDVLSLWRGIARRGGSMRQDLRFALRLCRRNPTPVIVAVAGLALAIGAVSGAFSIVNATMLRPYGMDDPSSVVRVVRLDHGERPWPYWTYESYRRMHDGMTSAVEASLLERIQFDTAAPGESGRSQLTLFVSGGYLEMLGGRPVVGRPLQTSDDSPGAAPVAVIGHHLWTTVLDADPAVVGRTVWVNGVAVIVVGVLDKHFSGPESLRPAVWVPLTLLDDVQGGSELTPRSTMLVEVLARLAPGASRTAAEDQLAALVNDPARAPVAWENERSAAMGLIAASSPLSDADAEDYIVLGIVFALLGLVLVLACANTANLLLAAAATRMREIGVRLALGATGRRLLVQLTWESLLLAGVAGMAGYLLAIWLAPVFALAIDLQPEVSVAPDWRVLLFALGVAGMCGLGAGLSPARFASRHSVLSVLRAHLGGQDGPRLSTRRRAWFVGFQAAASMLLLALAALLGRTAILASTTDPGLDVDRLISVHLQTPRDDFDEDAYLLRAVAAVRELPGIEAVALSQTPPFGFSISTIALESINSAAYTLYRHRTDADYFATAGIRIVKGRAFTESEVRSEAPVALISEGVWRRFYGGTDPIGQSLARIPTTNPLPPAVIIGVAGDALVNTAHGQAMGTLYMPLERERSNPPGLVVRAANPGVAAYAAAEALRPLDARVRPSATVIQERFDTFINSKRMMAWLVGPIALLALILAALGIFGVTAIVASQRTHEVTVRLAIGASSSDVLRLLTLDSLRPVAVGLLVGLLAVVGAGRFIATMFTGISAHDPTALGLAAVALLTSAFVAVLVPIGRVARTDPADVLRDA